MKMTMKISIPLKRKISNKTRKLEVVETLISVKRGKMVNHQLHSNTKNLSLEISRVLERIRAKLKTLQAIQNKDKQVNHLQ
jgi:hypothetical protein